ncbi:STAS/SEC14 domain-containing protein [Chitinibacter bivalviorum]|uniref:STAS/SEC14 domain-containing protein n=1 Tax=Chitinibacter bivalviorum TaxID=2739434 RepID=A0A7H9BH73_9NEIS|nr:STAS/SEC14 domain-containing protein [Chitinibacter bivalviorum]QLG87955.1 STAS/SEC14 domain-containing protein [Chitinibacter bivalviorum]
MISISHESSYIHVVIFGQFTLQDYKEFEENVLYDIGFHGPAKLLFDLTEMTGYTIDMALEEINFSSKHQQDFSQVAVVTDDQWVVWSVWINRAIADSNIMVFESVNEALNWFMDAEVATDIIK